MSTAPLTRTTRIARPAEEVAAWLARPGVAARLTPPWISSTHPAAAAPPPAFDKSRIAIKSLDHTTCEITENDSDSNARLLAYRHATIRDDIEHTAAYGAVRRLRIAIAGSSGMIGRALTAFLQTQNHEVVPLARNANGIFEEKNLAHALHAADAVINLAGASIAAAKWTQPQRDTIWESRAATTRSLIAALAKQKHRPFAYLNASATGYYGTRGNDLLTEDSPRGTGFLADVCAGWEHETLAAEELGLRTTLLRFGMVLSPAGGALAAMIPFFRKGLGAPLGHGRQWTSWVSIDDAIAAIYHAILTQTCAGPVNITAPNPATNADFATALARALNKKTFAAVPRWAVRLRYGIDFANETLLASARAEPAKLRASGYAFRHATLADALAHLLP